MKNIKLKLSARLFLTFVGAALTINLITTWVVSYRTSRFFGRKCQEPCGISIAGSCP
ncbi:MAG: hypothetical protein HC905_15540 [Bacteroidales bacterium]|nr:hypothetical protein [Bacteroidales bacterium]